MNGVHHPPPAQRQKRRCLVYWLCVLCVGSAKPVAATWVLGSGGPANVCSLSYHAWLVKIEIAQERGTGANSSRTTSWRLHSVTGRTEFLSAKHSRLARVSTSVGQSPLPKKRQTPTLAKEERRTPNAERSVRYVRRALGDLRGAVDFRRISSGGKTSILDR
jgi:hypothetical protein